MNTASLLLFAIIAAAMALALYGILLYNRLVTSRNMVEEGWSGIDVQLKRRADLIPNLLETVRGYADHERGVFEAVTRARAQATAARGPDESCAAENHLTSALRQLFAVAEAYPALQSDRNFRDLQSQLTGIEDQIQTARRYYNGTVRRLNSLVELFPSNLVAARFHFERAVYFEIDDPHSREVPAVRFGQA